MDLTSYKDFIKHEILEENRKFSPIIIWMKENIWSFENMAKNHFKASCPFESILGKLVFKKKHRIWNRLYKWVFERKERNTFIIREARLPIFQETPTFVMINDFIDFSVCKICARVRRTLPIFCTSKQRYFELCDLLTAFFHEKRIPNFEYYEFFCMQWLRRSKEDLTSKHFEYVTSSLMSF